MALPQSKRADIYASLLGKAKALVMAAHLLLQDSVVSLGCMLSHIFICVQARVTCYKLGGDALRAEFMYRGPHRRIVYQDIYAADGVVAACEGLQVLGLKSGGCPLPAARCPALLLVPPSRLISLRVLGRLRRT